MSHHSDEMRSPIMDSLIKELSKSYPQGDPSLGPTNKFPDGKLDPTDQGEIGMGVTVKDKTVVLAFGKPVAWVGFTPDQADEIARLLITRAIEARK